jgi:excisionase family DNA binding protein
MATSQHSQLSVVPETSRRERPAQPDDVFEPLLECKEAAVLLRIHPKTLLAKARSGEVPAIHVGRLWWFRASPLNEWFKKMAS